MENTVQIKYYSGYIRNFKALCGELGIDPGLCRDDRERAILTAAYQKWSVGMTEHIYGAYAFALYDEALQKLYVIRDYVGQKQMFYSAVGGELLYSGDIDEIASDPRYTKQLNKRMTR